MLRLAGTALNRVSNLDRYQGGEPYFAALKFEDVNTYKGRSSLRKRIVSQNLIPYICSVCKNNGEWNGSKLSLQLHHKNGNGKDHKLENVEFLCPNCHSQTSNFSGRSVKRKEYTDEELLKALKSSLSIASALKSLGMSIGNNYDRCYRILEENGISIVSSRNKEEKLENCIVCGKEIKPTVSGTCSLYCLGRLRERINWDEVDLKALYEECGSVVGIKRALKGVVSDTTIRKHLKRQGIKCKSNKERFAKPPKDVE